MLDRVPLVRQDIICREEGDEILMFDPITENVKVANQTAYQIWLWCDGTRTIADVMALMSREYPDVDPELVAEDLRQFFEDMEAQGLVSYLAEGSS